MDSEKAPTVKADLINGDDTQGPEQSSTSGPERDVQVPGSEPVSTVGEDPRMAEHQQVQLIVLCGVSMD